VVWCAMHGVCGVGCGGGGGGGERRRRDTRVYLVTRSPNPLLCHCTLVVLWSALTRPASLISFSFLSSTSPTALLGSWHVLDHVRWLQGLQLVSGDPGRTGRISFVLNTFGHAIELYHHLTKLAALKKRGKDGSSAAAQDKLVLAAVVRKHRKGAAKSAMNVVTFAHVADFVPTHDTVCGSFGVITSLMDVYDQWPRPPVRGDLAAAAAGQGGEQERDQRDAPDHAAAGHPDQCRPRNVNRRPSIR